VCSALLFLTAVTLPAPLLTLTGPPVALAASPAPSSGSADTRSAGEGPGFVGAPLLAIGAVLGLGLLAVVGTIAYVRLTGGPGSDPEREDRNPAARR
jgi:hypothetical protein